MKIPLTVLVLLWSSGLQAEEHHSPEPSNFRLMRGASRCAGGLEMKLSNDWKPVDDVLFDWTLRTAAAVCRQLDCGSVLSAKIQHSSTARHVWKIKASSVQSGSELGGDVSVTAKYSTSSLDLACSESVRLVNGTTLCSGRLEVRANQSWSSVCKSGFDWQDAEVACRELGCGALLSFQWSIFKSETTPEWRKEFKCRGNESALLNCETRKSARKACSLVTLKCSEPDNVRLVEEGHRCAGRLEIKLQDEWKPVDGLIGDLEPVTSACRKLNCGFALSAEIKSSAARSVWGIVSSGVESTSALRERLSTRPWYSSSSLQITCSEKDMNGSQTASPHIFIGRLVGLLLTLASFLYAICYHRKATRGQKPGGQENFELVYYNDGASRVEGSNEEAGVQGTDL